MTENNGDYNLIDKRWIPVLMRDGELRRVGILEAFNHAFRIREIAASNPMDRLGVLRFLLAVLYWCRGNPPDKSQTALGAPFPSNWFSKLEENKDLFNLLGDGTRFYQYRGGGTRLLPANYLVHEIPTGTNHWHFQHARDNVDGLCPACCAMALLRLPLFTTQGGAGKAPGINGKPPIYVVPFGSSLGQTLRLLWQYIPNVGTPVWENPAMQLPKTGEIPLLTGLTWFPRWVWLGDPEEPEDTCVSCGRSAILIRRSIFAGKGSSIPKEGQAGPIWRDPHVIYNESPKYGVMPLRPRNPLNAPAVAAREWANVLERTSDWHDAALAHAGVQIWVVSFPTDGNKYFDAIEYRLPFPSTTPDLPEETMRLEQWRRWRPRAASSALKAAISSIIPHAEGKVSARAGELLAGDESAWANAADEYRPMMAALARSLSPGFTTAAVRRREKIAALAPETQPKKEADRKPGRKKGGSV